MQIGKVIGTVVATVRTQDLEGVPFLWIQPLAPGGEPSGEAVVAADALGTVGPGEIVYYVASREAALTLRKTFVPVDHAIVGIVDAATELDP